MKKEMRYHIMRHILTGVFLLAGIFWSTSCRDEYIYDNEEPEWLGASIYDYLKEQ